MTLRSLLLCLAVGISPLPGLAQDAPLPGLGAVGAEDGPAEILADEVTYDRDTGVVVARGNVQITHANRVLFADTVTYNQKDGRATASGNVSIVQPDGSVAFAEFAEVTGDLRDALARNVRLTLADGSRFSAERIRREAGERSELNEAVYTACDLCPKDPDAAPIWRVKADSVVQKAKGEDVVYRDATLEMWGVPVLYTPYLSHPDPSVKRRTGFLVPEAGSSSSLGLNLRTPYFIELDDHQDMTVTPIGTTEAGVGLAGEYRLRFTEGLLDLDGSAILDEDSDRRSHIRGQGRWHMSPMWRSGFDLALSSDDTQLRRYGFASPPQLTNRLFGEGFSSRSYASLESLYYQGLRQEDDPGLSPLVLPYGRINWRGEAAADGSYWTVDGSILSLTRDEGNDAHRASATVGWHQRWVTGGGNVFNLDLSLRGDGYSVADVSRDNRLYDGETGRVVPTAVAGWKLPLTREASTGREVLEPTVQLVAVPRGLNPTTIPNNDSVDVEFADANLFSANRFPGLDRVESGARVDYGVDWAWYGGDTQVDARLGQSVRITSGSPFPNGSGLDDRVSDVVGRLSLRYQDLTDVYYRFRLDHDGLDARRNELGFSVGVPALRLTGNYLFTDAVQGEGLRVGDREELSGTLASRVTRFWSGQTTAVYDLTDGGRFVGVGLGVTYEDECFTFTGDFRRDYTYDRDVESGYSVVFRVVLKTLGEAQINAR